MHSDLRLYAILRNDISMSPGKAIAQAGHAFVDALVMGRRAAASAAYTKLRPGTKIALEGGSEQSLLHLHRQLISLGHPAVLIYDQGHIEPPDFDGSPTLTAVGVGPIARADAPRILKRLPLWPAPMNGRRA